MQHQPRRLRSGARRVGTALAIIATLVTAGCSDADPVNLPPPGGTQSPTDASDVRAPNGTNMGAEPPNVGSATP